jgi:hypothetical protein
MDDDERIAGVVAFVCEHLSSRPPGGGFFTDNYLYRAIDPRRVS